MRSALIGILILIAAQLGLAAGTPRAVATTTMIYDLVKQIGGDKVEVRGLLAAGRHRRCTADLGRPALRARGLNGVPP